MNGKQPSIIEEVRRLKAELIEKDAIIKKRYAIIKKKDATIEELRADKTATLPRLISTPSKLSLRGQNMRWTPVGDRRNHTNLKTY